MSVIRSYWRDGDRFLMLLVSLITTMLVLPIFDSPFVREILASACLTFVFVTGALANRQRPYIFGLAVALAVAAVTLAWVQLASVNVGVQLADLIVDIAFFFFTAVMILVAVFRDQMGNRQAVSGAICAYLLLGLGWAHGYVLLSYLESPPFHFANESIADSEKHAALSQMIYYSFVTMTTLGYGDITPRTPLAQTITWMQAVTGQLFIAVLIARLVMELPSVSKR